MKLFKPKTKRTNPYPQLPQIWGKNKNRSKKTEPNKIPTTKQMGQQLWTELCHRPGVWSPSGGVPGRCASPSNKRALDSGGFRASDNCLEPFLTSPFFSHLSLRLSLPSTSHLSAFGSNVFGVLFYPKISVWEIFPPFAVLSLPFFQPLYCFLLMFLLLLSWHFC